MQNFNTNQTRFLYVAAALDANVDAHVDTNIDTNLGIALRGTDTGELYLKYKNSEGLVTRSDTFLAKNIVSLKLTTAAELVTPLRAHVVAVDTGAVTLANLVGKVLNCSITIHQVVDYDDSSSFTFVASIVGDSTNTASAAAFHKALAIAIAKAMPKYDKQYPVIKVYSSGTEVTSSTAESAVTGSANGVVLVEAPQKFVLGKLTGEPATISVAFNYDGEVWGTDTVMTVDEVNTAQGTSISPDSISGTYKLAELERFAAGEKGDYVRGWNYPNEYQFVPAITDYTKNYDVLSIEYFWQGAAENIVKSPRLIQVAAESSTNVCSDLYNAIIAKM